MSKRFQPSGNVTRALPPPAPLEARHELRGAGVVGEEVRAARRLAPAPPLAGAARGRRGAGCRRGPRTPARRRRAASGRSSACGTSTSTGRPCPGRARRVETKSQARRRDHDAGHRERHQPTDARAAARAACPAGGRRPGPSFPGPSRPALSLAAACPSPLILRRSDARRATTGGSRTPRPRRSGPAAFLPRTSLAVRERGACTVVSRSSQSSTSRPVASAICCAICPRLLRRGPPRRSCRAGSPTTNRGTFSPPPPGARAQARAPCYSARPADGPAGVRHDPQLVVDGDADARPPGGRARTLPPGPAPGTLRHHGTLAARARALIARPSSIPAPTARRLSLDPGRAADDKSRRASL